MATMLPLVSMTAAPSKEGSKPTSNSMRWSIFPPRRELHAGPASCTAPQMAVGPRRGRPTTAVVSPTRSNDVVGGEALVEITRADTPGDAARASAVPPALDPTAALAALAPPVLDPGAALAALAPPVLDGVAD